VTDGGRAFLGRQRTSLEPVEAERRDQLTGTPGGDHLGDRLAGDRACLENKDCIKNTAKRILLSSS
jgi:hypothetical protein